MEQEIKELSLKAIRKDYIVIPENYDFEQALEN